MEKEDNTLSFFCARCYDRLSAILFEKDGIILLYKRLFVDGRSRDQKTGRK